MRLGITISLLSLVASSFAAAPSRAQDLRVQVEIERTDRRIERAQAVVATSDNEAARTELSEAIRIQANAKDALAQARLRIALDLTYRARARADRAIALVSGLPDPDRVLAQLERTRELIDRARERIEECEQDRARAMLRTAADMQTRAEEAGHAGHYLAAIQLTLGARERAHRALRLCNLSENAQDGAERALHRTDEVIQRAQDRASGAPQEARSLLARASDLQVRAREEFRAGHYEPSIRLTLSARAFAFRALRLSGVVN
jgi:hypothetical protein